VRFVGNWSANDPPDCPGPGIAHQNQVQHRHLQALVQGGGIGIMVAAKVERRADAIPIIEAQSATTAPGSPFSRNRR